MNLTLLKSPIPSTPRKVLTCALATAFMAVPLSHGQSILSFDLSDVPNETLETFAPTAIAGGLSSNGLLRGPGLNATNLTAGFSTNQYTIGANNPSRQTAIANGEWIGFDVSVMPGFTASLSALDISLRRSALNGPMFYEWQYSFDAFATPGTTIVDFTYRGRSSGAANEQSTNPDDYMKFGAPDSYLDPFDLPPDLSGQSSSTTQPGNPMPTIDLTGFVDLQDIEEGNTITFGLFAWGNASTSATNTVAFGRIDGPELSGTVIPEPSTYALLFGLGVLGAALVIRRRGRQA